MAGAEAILSALERNWDMVDAALAGLDDAALGRRPSEQSNSVAWVLWHMDRVVDTFINVRLQSKSQLWITGRWYERHGMSDDPDERGVGWTADQVGAWAVPPRESMLGYYEAVKADARAYISSRTDRDMDVSKVIPPSSEPRTIGAALGQMTWDNVAHGGQIAYLRGLFLGMGWYR